MEGARTISLLGTKKNRHRWWLRPPKLPQLLLLHRQQSEEKKLKNLQ
jgi:hypothetical protein